MCYFQTLKKLNFSKNQNSLYFDNLEIVSARTHMLRYGIALSAHEAELHHSICHYFMGSEEDPLVTPGFLSSKALIIFQRKKPKH